MKKFLWRKLFLHNHILFQIFRVQEDPFGSVKVGKNLNFISIHLNSNSESNHHRCLALWPLGSHVVTHFPLLLFSFDRACTCVARPDAVAVGSSRRLGPLLRSRRIGPPPHLFLHVATSRAPLPLPCSSPPLGHKSAA
jgi:hypothetical protein